jgi:hypothetical protein
MSTGKDLHLRHIIDPVTNSSVMFALRHVESNSDLSADQVLTSAH